MARAVEQLMKFSRGILGTLLAFGSGAAAADDPLLEPLYAKNLSPVAGLFGLPSQRAATTTAAGTGRWALHGSIANHFVTDETGSEQLNLDGETHRLALELRHGLFDGWEVQLELPWLQHGKGVLDGAIDNWHDLWGMPDSGRGKVRRDMIDYRYADPRLRFALLESSSGFGDVSLALQRRLFRDEAREVSASLGYKFGTGSANDLTGSGESDAYAAVRASATGSAAFSWFGQLGYLRAGQIALGPRQERYLWFAGAGLSWRHSPTWALLAQLDAHAAPLESALDALGGDTLLLSIGARWRLAPPWSVEVSLVEDIAVETAPDVTFRASLRYYGAR